jgi:hypothetical protein
LETEFICLKIIKAGSDTDLELVVKIPKPDLEKRNPARIRIPNKGLDSLPMWLSSTMKEIYRGKYSLMRSSYG